jgi:hypothetical protein
MARHRIFAMPFARVYPEYVQKQNAKIVQNWRNHQDSPATAGLIGGMFLIVVNFGTAR